ncbi:divergent polysaccharide deacetylase family protein [Parvularcula marina]|uniref:divergent polysaccharide deacetylase family protein n=1 Tax=Parvularcula marina TaxID=2292771 RepID=UPI00351892C0
MTFLLHRSLSWVRAVTSGLKDRRKLGWAAIFLIGVLSGVIFGISTGMPVSNGFAAPAGEDLRLRGSARTIMALRTPDAVIPAVPDGLMPVQPKIAIVIDDLGLSWEAFRAVNDLPSPVTLSFLPYAGEAQGMIDQVAPGHEVMLHLPMEPLEKTEDAGPGMLKASLSEKALRAQLLENLTSLSGYSGVNNHTGSKFTSDPSAMEVVLSELDQRGLFFLDSITTSRPVAARIGQVRGYDVLERNVFLDHDYEHVSAETVKMQLAELEAIARADGYAIGIGHPYKATAEALSEWMGTADVRGFEVVVVRDLLPPEPPQTLASR